MRTTALLTLIAVLLQELPASDPQDPPQAQSTSAEELRARVHDMRMNILLGGDRVREAEAEAIGFYEEKLDLVEERMDRIRADLSEKKATYELALGRTLAEESGEQRARAMREASRLRKEIDALETESESLKQKRTFLSGLISTVASREGERQALATQLETASDFEAASPLPFTSIGLAPSFPVESSASPFEDAALIEDLMLRDPRAARRVLFESDPEGYWERFPLRPPADVLRAAFDFPLPDLPQER